jgi:predicted DNA-binding protein|tara:strand:- start:55 stop:837 length:783 start_codon:yes stop_codon:yes gene_type:complete
MNNLKQKSQEVNKVYMTNDLDIFNDIEGNRPPNPQHIRRLTESIRLNGILQNPIIVNQNNKVIDGQHRLLAAKKAKSSIYYIKVKGYDLKEVQTLNLNQKNWTRADFMEGYAKMGVESYVKLRDFANFNKEFNLSTCTSLCSNTTSDNNNMSQKFRRGKSYRMKEVFEEGTWIGKDFNLAQENANKLKMIKPYYEGYKKSRFIGAMLGLFVNENFDFFEFLNKLKLQTQKLQDCANVAQYKLLIEDIYNYRRREKVNLRF